MARTRGIEGYRGVHPICGGALVAAACAACAGGDPAGPGRGASDAGLPPILAPDAGRPDAAPSGPPDAGATSIIYVATSGFGGNPGTDPQQPLRNVAAGVAAAAACAPDPCEVRVAGGSYAETVELASGVDVIGGYAPDFAYRDPVRFPVEIAGSEARVVIADGLAAPTKLAGVNVRGADFAADRTGRTSYGLWVRDSADHLRLDRVAIAGGRAGSGADGADGEVTVCDARGGAGGDAFDCGSRAGTDGRAGGDDRVGGGPGGGGRNNCPSACPLTGSDGISDGTAGSNGANGADGANGAGAVDDDGAFVDGLWAAALGQPGLRGRHGTGGGGGGSGGTKRIRACFGCGTLYGGRGGDGAPGGCGGGAGAAGSAGGGAFGLALIRSSVRVTQVTVIGGIGGDGGAGGNGHPGGAGGTDGDVGRQGRASRRCGLINYSSGGGAPGGIGGHGGHGGGGAGGVGGASIALALVEGGEVVESEPGAIVVEAGQPGAGGLGGTGLTIAPAGIAGRAAAEQRY